MDRIGRQAYQGAAERRGLRRREGRRALQLFHAAVRCASDGVAAVAAARVTRGQVGPRGQPGRRPASILP
jgi:hypothetical protein